MKNFYIAVTIEENGLFYSFVKKVNTGDNLKTKLSDSKIIYASICETKKQAEALCEFWRKEYKANGIYMFANTF